MLRSARASLERFEQGYVLGLLDSPYKSLRAMVVEAYVPYHKSQVAVRLAADPLAHQHGWEERLEDAPKGGYLAVDLLSVAHVGEGVEGLGRVWSSSDKSRPGLEQQ